MRIVALAVAETLVWAGSYYLFPALLTHIEREEDWDRRALTCAYTGALLSSAAAAPIAGHVVDLGKGRLLLTSAAICSGVIVSLRNVLSSELSPRSNTTKRSSPWTT